jgi:hypothetical protein
MAAFCAVRIGLGLGLLWAVGWLAAICWRRGDASGKAGCGQTPFVSESSAKGQAEARANLMRRALMRTRPASLRSLSRIVPHVALSELRVGKADAPERAQENTGEHRRKRRTTA